MSFKYTITRESLTVIVDGVTHTLRATEKNFTEAVAACVADSRDALMPLLVKGIAIEKWLGENSGFTYNRADNRFYFGGEPVPEKLSRRAVAIAEEGNDPNSLLRFWQRLQRNPSMRSVKQLYEFLDHCGIPITEDGCFLAYKGVQSNYRDKHSGKFDNRPGNHHKMPRNKISDDPREACHVGFHVGSLSYARKFASGGRVVITKVDPEHVVCVPYDSSQEKMRVCEYEVVGNYGDKMPDTVIPESDLPPKAPAPPQPKAPAPAKGEVKNVADPDGGVTPDAEAWTFLIDADDATVAEANLGLLRKYARHHLKIVGASKIPGGKPVLLERIFDVRNAPEPPADEEK